MAYSATHPAGGHIHAIRSEFDRQIGILLRLSQDKVTLLLDQLETLASIPRPQLFDLFNSGMIVPGVATLSANDLDILLDSPRLSDPKHQRVCVDAAIACARADAGNPTRPLSGASSTSSLFSHGAFSHRNSVSTLTSEPCLLQCDPQPGNADTTRPGSISNASTPFERPSTDNFDPHRASATPDDSKPFKCPKCYHRYTSLREFQKHQNRWAGKDWKTSASFKKISSECNLIASIDEPKDLVPLFIQGVLYWILPKKPKAKSEDSMAAAGSQMTTETQEIIPERYMAMYQQVFDRIYQDDTAAGKILRHLCEGKDLESHHTFQQEKGTTRNESLYEFFCHCLCHHCPVSDRPDPVLPPRNQPLRSTGHLSTFQDGNHNEMDSTPSRATNTPDIPQIPSSGGQQQPQLVSTRQTSISNPFGWPADPGYQQGGCFGDSSYLSETQAPPPPTHPHLLHDIHDDTQRSSTYFDTTDNLPFEDF